MKLVSFEKKDVGFEAHIFLDNEEFNKELDNVYNHQKKWFNISGFRRGKAPRGIIERTYGFDVFYESACYSLYSRIVNFIHEETHEDILALRRNLSVDIPKNRLPQVSSKSSDGVDLKIFIDVYPKISVKYNDETITIPPHKLISNDEVSEYKKSISKSYSKFVKMPGDYIVQNGDRIRADMKAAFIDDSENELPDNNEYDIYTDGIKNVAVEVGSGHSMPEFENAFIGHSKSEGKFSRIIDFPVKDTLKIFSGKKMRFDLSINEVQRIDLISDEELSKNLKLDSVDKLDPYIRETLEKKEDKEFENRKISKVYDFILSQVDDSLIQESLIDLKVNESMKELSDNLTRNGISLEQYYYMMNTTSDRFMKRIREMVLSELKLLIASRNIANDFNLTCSEEEIENLYSKLSKSYRVSSSYIKNEIPVVTIKDDILRDKALSKVVSYFKIVESDDVKPIEESTNANNDNKSDSIPGLDIKE